MAIDVEASEKFVFDHWEGFGATPYTGGTPATGGDVAFNIDAAVALTAVFQQTKAEVRTSVWPPEAGSVARSPDKPLYDIGESVTLEATAASADWTFVGWRAHGLPAGAAASVTFPITEDVESEFRALRERWDGFDFFFVHVKGTDSRGEDGDFDGKVKVIEEVDRHIPMITDLKPDVLAVTADHSTPAKMKSHSWHPVPLLIGSPYVRRNRAAGFDEISCATGALGRRPSIELMPLLLANALKLRKFGA